MEVSFKEIIFGIHPILEAVEAGKTVNKVLMKRGLRGEQADMLAVVLRQHNISVQQVPQEKLQRITRKNHQGVIAFLSPIEYHRLDMLLPQVYERGENPLFLLLDGVTDVRNFGAIARTAECAGAHGIVLPKKGGALVGADAVKTSAGALMRIPVCREESLKATVEYLQWSGVRVIGASEKTQEEFYHCDYTGPTAIVMGAEGSGLSQEVLTLVDQLAAIPIQGKTNSLNVSVSAALFLYEAVRQRSS